MGKTNRGGKRGLTSGSAPASPAPRNSAGGGGSSSSANAQPQQQQQAQPVQQVQPAQTMSASYNQFIGMNDDQKASVIEQNIKQGVPVHLANNDFQKFIYNMDLNDKPDVVSESALSKISGQDVYRTVNQIYDAQNDYGYTAPQICKQVIGGRSTRVSDTGGSAYGRGIYFATTRRSSVSYGHTTGNITKTAVIHAKLNSNAKIIDYFTASSGANKEINSGSKLGLALKKCDRQSQVSIYAMAKGYNVISDGMNDYMCVLNRNALTCSDKFTAK